MEFNLIIHWNSSRTSWTKKGKLFSCEDKLRCDLRKVFAMSNFYCILILTVAPKRRDLRMHPSRWCAVDYLLIACKKQEIREIKYEWTKYNCNCARLSLLLHYNSVPIPCTMNICIKVLQSAIILLLTRLCASYLNDHLNGCGSRTKI